MWKCPVCDQKNNATVCPRCGYDQTCDYEQYPTAFAVTTATPTRTLRRRWQAKQGPALADLIADWFVESRKDGEDAAERCFRRLAEGGDPAAQWWLGVSYQYGVGAPKDRKMLCVGSGRRPGRGMPGRRSPFGPWRTAPQAARTRKSCR